MLSVGSLFSGVGGFDLGLERAGMRVVFQCEIDAWCRGILAQHWPGVACYEDVRDVGVRPRSAFRCSREGRGEAVEGTPTLCGERVDLLCGGFPCQDLSVAGRRAGLSGERSGLFFEFARVADELVRPGGWIVVENVPGLLSSVGGRDFAVVVRTLGDIGFHDLAWRVLDSRYFGVPQRRRRVFIVGRRAAGTGAREVLLEPESGGGDFAPSRQAGPRVAASLSRGSSGPGVSAPGRRQEDDENIVSTLQGGAGRRGHRIDAEGAAGGQLVAPAIVKRYAKGTDSDATDALLFNLRGREEGARVEPADAASIRASSGGSSRSYVAHTLRAEGFDASEDGTGRGTPLISTPSDPDGMRTPPRLPRRVDDPPPDGPRYAAMGNAVTVPVAEWIGRRILEYENEGAVGSAI